MPTNLPRLQVTLEPETYAALKRLSAVQGRPASAIVREVLHSATPLLSEVSDMMEQISAAQDAVQARLVDEASQGLTEAHDALQPMLTGLLGHLHEVADQITELAGDVPSEDGEGAPHRPEHSGASTGRSAVPSLPH